MRWQNTFLKNCTIAKLPQKCKIENFLRRSVIHSTPFESGDSDESDYSGEFGDSGQSGHSGEYGDFGESGKSVASGGIW